DTTHIVVEKMTSRDKKKLGELLEKYNLTPISMSAHCDLTTQEGLEAFTRRMDFAMEFNINKDTNNWDWEVGLWKGS
ncbi:MAG: hypothetical protein ACUVTO_05025, partial [Candidatus Caldatribacteriaceae bacterium]